MNWEHLFTTERSGSTPGRNRSSDDIRSAFQVDNDRIVFSSPFRRLQNKTQVFPLPGSVFVHNRLTHSLEVAAVGRSLGKSVGELIAARYPDSEDRFKEFYRYELPSVIAAACLAHDIGNPPFGHSGEEAIRTFFLQDDSALHRTLAAQADAGQLADLQRFEGNSNALRVLTHRYNETEARVYRLTYTTLAALVKYPCSSLAGFNKQTGLIATKKSGFFTSEAATYTALADTLGIPAQAGHTDVYVRHPFVYLTEAADDICYRVIDLEDAHRLGIVSLEQFTALFLPFFPVVAAEGSLSQGYISDKMAAIHDTNQKVQYLRAVWIGHMVKKVVQAFMENEALLLAGNLQTDLLHCLPEADIALIKHINAFSVQHVYNYRSVIEIELAGYNIIGGLLREFGGAVLQHDKARSQKLIRLVSAQFPLQLKEGSLFADLQSVVDFISGMTDLYAIDLYRKISGITIPELR
ncbi:MAG: dNTP triphosphohydrolase [Chitinophagia bacterium]|nr:dNTP triphosphohydrolase [Chitinophagia bacterium]